MVGTTPLTRILPVLLSASLVLSFISAAQHEEKAVAASLEWHGVTQNTLFLLHDWCNTLHCYNLFVIVFAFVCLLESYR